MSQPEKDHAAREFLQGRYTASLPGDEQEGLTEEQLDAGSTPWRHHGKLTAKELEIVQDISHGLTNEMIAEVRGKSKWTVQRQVETARSALNAKTRAHLVAQAFREGLIR